MGEVTGDTGAPSAGLLGRSEGRRVWPVSCNNYTILCASLASGPSHAEQGTHVLARARGKDENEKRAGVRFLVSVGGTGAVNRLCHGSSAAVEETGAADSSEIGLCCSTAQYGVKHPFFIIFLMPLTGT